MRRMVEFSACLVEYSVHVRHSVLMIKSVEVVHCMARLKYGTFSYSLTKSLQLFTFLICIRLNFFLKFR